MSRITDNDLELDLDSTEVDVIEEEDFAIVVTPDGQLKSIFFPVGSDPDAEVPENIQKIMAIFGVTDASDLSSMRTLH